MNAQLSLEEKRDLLKDRLNESLQKKRGLELQIAQQFEELKKLEATLEKRAQTTATMELGIEGTEPQSASHDYGR